MQNLGVFGDLLDRLLRSKEGESKKVMANAPGRSQSFGVRSSSAFASEEDFAKRSDAKSDEGPRPELALTRVKIGNQFCHDLSLRRGGY